jgi:hypothetical protein
VPRDPRHRLRIRWSSGGTSRTRSTGCRRACWCAPTRARRSSASTTRSPPSAPTARGAWPTAACAWSASTTASIDPADSKTLDSHQVIRRRDLRVLENLWLDDVPEGDYEADRAAAQAGRRRREPVRAVLRALA